MRISEVLAGKARQDVVTIAPDASVRELLGLLAVQNVGAVVVSRDGRSMEGIVSERDVVRRLNEDESILSSPVSTIMTTDVHSCDGTEPVLALMKTMTDRRVRHVPVVTDGELVGVVSIGDVVKSRIAELEFERDQLDSYVHSAGT
jgi:CBS domain-containing protein